MEIELEGNYDAETMELIKDQLYFDQIGLGINHDDLVHMYLLEIFHMN
jgi:hypothetical protein